MNLLPSFGKRGPVLNLLTKKVDIEDTADSSKYFVITEIDTVFTAGRNPVAFNGSSLLKDKSEVQIECIDSNGNSLYFEQAKSKIAQFTDVSNFVVSFHVYGDSYNGPAKLVFVGITIDNRLVRWVRNITIDKTLTNSKKVRFYNEPTLEIRPLLYPVVDLGLASEVDVATVYRQATATATVIGFVSSITFISPGFKGSGYTSAPGIVIGAPTGPNPRQATATCTLSGDYVASVTITDAGRGYITSPAITFVGGGFVVQATAQVNITNQINTIAVTSGGLGYTTIPGITFTGGSGAGAVAHATISGGKVTAITIDDNGDGYVSAPDIVIDDPTPTTAADLNVALTFQSQFYSYPVNPLADTNQALVNKKRTEIDYRIVNSGISDADLSPGLIQTGSFNAQMEGRDITLTIAKIKLPLSHKEVNVNLTETFKVKKVVDTKTLVLNDPFYYRVGNSKFVATIISGSCSIPYNYIKYNTNPDSSLTTFPSGAHAPVNVKESYVEATYRNIKPFSGFIARHKLYRRSLFYPGEFQQISDEPLNAVELLTDTVTFNRAYYRLGTFYHQFHINKYWFSSSADITLQAKSSPLNSMYIDCGAPKNADGSKYVLVKTDTIGSVNDNNYYPYNSTEYNSLSGSSYNSNFINLKKDSLHALQSGIIIEKDIRATDAKVSFYFTSSVASIAQEPTYDPVYGLKIGEISTQELTSKKFFNQPQTLYFTPQDDYFGTLKIVPYKCNVTLSDLSLKAYGDTGFSPEVLVIRVPCPLNVANEAFEFRAELYDINHILIPTELKATEGVDPDGISLLGSDHLGQVLVVNNNNTTITSTAESFTINNNLYLPHLVTNCSPTDYNRLVTWNGLTGALERTPIINVSHDSEYITLRTGSCKSFLVTPVEGKSVNVAFDGSTGGRQIYWSAGVIKTVVSSSI